MDKHMDNIRKKFNELAEKIEQLDPDSKRHLDKDSQIVHLSYVCLDERDNEYKVSIDAYIDEEFLAKLIYRGNCLKTAKQIRDNLLDAFDLPMMGFDSDGIFYM